jgi:tetratricopeptide (TPR) repeat protein
VLWSLSEHLSLPLFQSLQTTIAAAVVRDSKIREAFDRIGWVSVGQTPDVMELQRALYQQLAGKMMAVKAGATAEAQLKELQAACVGKRFFIVIDDAWDKTHERQLNCIDPVSTSKVLVTTRIRGLVQGCDLLALGLLEPDGAAELLLRTGGVETTAASTAAAEKVVALCGYLPLYIGICGGIIHEYEGDAVWQAELVLMLKDDRLGVMEDGGADDCIVSASLSVLKDDVAESIFLGLGLCPEDVPVPVAAVQLIHEVMAGNAASAVTARQSLTKLLDRNLLQGSTASGVHPHDIVREYMRRKLGGEDAIREKQRVLVRAIVAAQADGGGWPGALDEYVRSSLQQHMGEALLTDPVGDSEAQAWVDSSDDVLNDLVARRGAEVIGASCLQAWAAEHESAEDLFTAAKRLLCASTTTEIRGSAIGLGTQSAAAAGLSDEALALLARCDTPRSRTLEALVIGSQFGQLGFSHPSNMPRVSRMLELVAAGVDVRSPAELVALGFTVMLLGFLEPWGLVSVAAGNHTTLVGLEKGFDSAKPGCLLFDRAIRECSDDRPLKVVAILYAMLPVSPLFLAGVKSRPEEMAFAHQSVSHERLQFAIDTYDFETHFPLLMETGFRNDLFLYVDLGYLALAIHGDVPLAQTYLRKAVAQYEAHYDRASENVYSATAIPSLRCSDSLYRRAGLVPENLAFIKAARAGFADCGALAEKMRASGVGAGMAWVSGPWSCVYVAGGGCDCSLTLSAKRNHWLAAPDEVDEAAFRAWLPPPEAGSAGWFDGDGAMHYDIGSNGVGCGDGAVAAEVFETLGEFENGLVAADTDLRCMPHHPYIQIEAGVARARCLAKLGRLEEAEAAFEKAIADAAASRFPFWEMLARRDLVVHVLDGAGRRDEQMAPLGRCIAALVRPAAEYTEVLGAGLDAEVAVAAFKG